MRSDQAQAQELMQQAQNHTDAMAAISNTLGGLPNAMQAALHAAQPPCGRVDLIDARGSGKRPAFSIHESDFLVWSRKVKGCVTSAFGVAQWALPYAA